MGLAWAIENSFEDEESGSILVRVLSGLAK